jgi:DUF1680 family protein
VSADATAEAALGSGGTAAAAAAALARPVVPARGSARGIGLGELTLEPGFWATLQHTNRHATLEHALDWMERLGWLANFDRVAAGTTGPERPGWQFSDSEVYKLMEAMAWEHGRTGDPEVDAMLRALTARVAAAQDADGYLNTCFGHPGRPPRYSDLQQGHELYCVGHLLQAAVARLRTHGPDPLVEVARRAADQVCREFGAGGREEICGHPVVEVGLAELGRALGEPGYVEQARLFVERRGHGLLGRMPLLSPAYFQDDIPVREADVWRGHAVRALYLSAAAVDVAVDLGDDELLAAIERQWTRSVERRTYLTGGMGSRHQDEGFGEDWELPPDRAYCETCAGVASIMVSWRLYLATGDVRYPDLIERTLLNVVATSPREDGRAFFYSNPLQQRVPGHDVAPDAVNPRAEGGVRAPWFEVSCCPTNVARTLASWQAYAASVDGDQVSLLQYAPARLDVALADGGSLGLVVRTGYPLDGVVDVEVVEAPDRPVALRLRVPAWAEGATLARAGGDAEPVAPGWAVVDVRAGDRVVLTLPVAPRVTVPDPRIDAVRGCVAVERGPVVLCLESVDLPPGVGIEDVRLDLDAGVRDDGDGALARLVAWADGAGLSSVRLVPYRRWAERGPSTMRVFVPVS